MPDPTPRPETSRDAGNDAHATTQRGETAGAPRWVVAFGIIMIILALLLGVMLLTGLGGEHGPRRHMSSSDVADYTPGVAHAHGAWRS
jgi:hypothetical protein